MSENVLATKTPVRLLRTCADEVTLSALHRTQTCSLVHPEALQQGHAHCRQQAEVFRLPLLVGTTCDPQICRKAAALFG